MDDLAPRSPEVIPLSRSHRRVMFGLMLCFFVLAVPALIFYATGYRYNVWGESNGVTATGGMYVSVFPDDAGIYINDEPVRGSRVFRRATYIQSITPGVARVSVQQAGLHTWVKELPIFPHIVTEADAFSLPVIPQVRLVTEFISPQNIALVQATSSVLSVFEEVALQNTFIMATTTLSTTSPSVVINTEYLTLRELFAPPVIATTTATSAPLFRFATSSNTTTPPELVFDIATTTIVRNNLEIFERQEQLFARYLGAARSTPHYFCVSNSNVASTTELYGAHVAYGVEQMVAVDLMLPARPQSETLPQTRICRNEIRIDTKAQMVKSFDFFPGLRDVVIVHLENGVFVVEIDDRAWQNVQQVYGATAEAVLVENNRVYIQEEEVFFELLPTIIGR